MLGPIGLAIGGAVGGGLAAAMAQGQFQPLARVILDMPQVGLVIHACSPGHPGHHGHPVTGAAGEADLLCHGGRQEGLHRPPGVGEARHHG